MTDGATQPLAATFLEAAGRGRRGQGSTLAYTATLRHELPALLARNGIRRLLDAPCGPFGWMGETDLSDVDYVGLDAAARTVADNNRLHGSASRRFLRGHVTQDPLPPADLMMCRHFLARLPYALISATLRNFLRSDIPHLLVSSHRNGHNRDVETPGEWRQLNLQRPPFRFPKPTAEIEDWVEGHPPCVMALWPRAAVEAALLAASSALAGAVQLPENGWAGRDLRGALVPIADIAAREVEFVTIVYRPELSLLRLQARSMAVNLNPKGVAAIHVIVNENEPAITLAAVQDLAAEYGPFCNRLTIHAAPDLSLARGVKGWRSQQSLKLLAARLVATPKYVALDAKNHFIRPAGVETFLAEDGRPLSFWTVQGGNLLNYLTSTLHYFGLDQALAAGRVMPTITPYTLYAAAVRDLLSDMEAVEGVPFETAFHAPGRDLTEFFLYYAYLVRNGADLSTLYSFGKRNTVTLFTRHPDTPERLAAMMSRLGDKGIALFGLHRNRIASLNPTARAQVMAAWLRGGLFSDEAEAEAYYDILINDVGKE